MAIIKAPTGWSNSVPSSTELFVGRVLEVRTVTEYRNWSDTLDYTDRRLTECTLALVWLGTHGVPPWNSGERHVVQAGVIDEQLSEYYTNQIRDLEPHEQFAWIDCTNIFSDRCGYSLRATADAFTHGMIGSGDKVMWTNYLLWQEHVEAEAVARSAKLAADVARHDAALKAAAEAKAKRDAKRNEKAAAGKAAAEAALARCPAKGSTVTVDGFTGRITWTGVKSYYGKWNARVGIKNTKGEMIWVDAQKLVA